MGWNSFDCFGSAVVEHEVRTNADYMACRLARFGWQYVVVDFCWSHPAPAARSNPDLAVDAKGELTPLLAMDAYGRQLPSVNRFPSAMDGAGFKPLADSVHKLGLKFGIHVMRGIPRQAVHLNLPILGSRAHAGEIADRNSTCGWLNHMYGLDMSKRGAQAYLDSTLKLYASWGVDYIKVDDISAPYHAAEIEGFRRAIDRCGRNIVLSLSPGASPLDQAAHLAGHANLWRISGDFWDQWTPLRAAFDLCRDWAPQSGPGHWPDADMLPLGRLALRGPIGEPRWTNFTRAEQITLMTLWSIFRSPLMMGGHMPDNDAWTESLLTNAEVMRVGQECTNSREGWRRGNAILWVADAPVRGQKYIAIFNVGDGPLKIAVDWQDLGIVKSCRVRDLWAHKNLGPFSKGFQRTIPSHGAGLFAITSSAVRAGK